MGWGPQRDPRTYSRWGVAQAPRDRSGCRMTIYASNTSVPTERSKAEIERMLTRYGASRFGAGWDETGATILFEVHGRRVRFHLPLPDPNAREYTHTPGRGSRRSTEDARQAWEQGCRARWRALVLIVKAKLEAVESGVTTFEDEFLAHFVTATGQTIGEMLGPALEAALNGKLPPMLGMGKP